MGGRSLLDGDFAFLVLWPLLERTSDGLFDRSRVAWAVAFHGPWSRVVVADEAITLPPVRLLRPSSLSPLPFLQASSGSCDVSRAAQAATEVEIKLLRVASRISSISAFTWELWWRC
ncbi:hypothetical protein Zm00014a_033400 [Zea mays]|uniref:Uncharacterized protein n=1 Tax=Zea mays TaxID=4577 RepID=A0A3L6F8Q8_MAIZE|nr:hypothetical protein Zm00014a_033400 [Zea mays]